MLLAVDIGNTTVRFGLFQADTLRADFRLATRTALSADEALLFIWGSLQHYDIELTGVTETAIASVVPRLTQSVAIAVGRLFNCPSLLITHRVKLPIAIDMPAPEQVGADRFANAAAGFAQYGGPLIIADFGTATTFDIVNESGAYIGGVITPGPESSLAELARKAARLFEVAIEPPEQVVGRNTVEALKSGLFYGTVGQVDFLIEKIIAETGFENVKVIATGGLAGGIAEYSRYISGTDDTLTLEGIRLISEANR
jgi:type III pantothenate kinase